MMTGENGAAASPGRVELSPGMIAAGAAALVACAVLLAGIQYCPSYGAGKITLWDMWVNTFWDDLSTQISGIFAGASKETQSAEASASEWNYCLLVPIIVGWLVWRQWPQVRETAEDGGRAGYALLGMGFFLYLAGFLMESYYIGFGAMEFIYAGLVLLILGRTALRLLLFPIAFLMFMWPYNFMEDVALELRLRMSALSHYVLQFIDVPNMLSGTAIMSPPGAGAPFAIDIADPCSGIRSLFALVMIAALYAFIAFDKLWQQALIVGLSIPLVFLGNLVRIVILTLGTIHFGENFALGTNDHPSWFHEGAGYLVYFINFGGLIGLGSLLTRATAPRPPDAEPPPDSPDEPEPPDHART
jgi:exosortase